MKRHAQDREQLYSASVGALQRSTGRLFFGLLVAQWAGAVTIALLYSPFAWAGPVRSVHFHVLSALCFGALLNSLPLVLLRIRPTWWLTLHVVAVSQVLWSSLLIHITDGRIETHFHIFVSLAFIAIYRDWRLLVTATTVVVADHLARGLFWPESIYGIANPEWWRLLEHAGWVVFEDSVLVLGCLHAQADMMRVADREASMEVLNRDIERKIELRTRELTSANANLAEEMRARLRLEGELRQGQKLEAVGRLAAGVAHEINTPVQFVGDSLGFVRDAVPELFSVLAQLAAIRQSVLAGAPSSEAAAQSLAAERAADLPYLVENIPKALDRALGGLGRVATIVRSMKEFAHPDAREMASVDLNGAVESTLVVAASEYKYVAEIERDFAELPRVTCYLGELNQVILNLIVNASHAIGDVVRGTDRKGTIGVRTSIDGADVVISISDTGTGIPVDIRDHVFDPFFTTKAVGSGTGQGLAVARSVVVDKHHGKLDFRSEVGSGTTFFIRIPIGGPPLLLEHAPAIAS